MGGFVYRGSELADLIGAYIYGGFGSGKIWALRFDDLANSVNAEILDTDLNIASFGVDEEDARAFGSSLEDPNWNQAAGLNNDDVVGIFDVVSLAQNFGKIL